MALTRFVRFLRLVDHGFNENHVYAHKVVDGPGFPEGRSRRILEESASHHCFSLAHAAEDLHFLVPSGVSG